MKNKVLFHLLIIILSFIIYSSILNKSIDDHPTINFFECIMLAYCVFLTFISVLIYFIFRFVFRSIKYLLWVSMTIYLIPVLLIALVIITDSNHIKDSRKWLAIVSGISTVIFFTAYFFFANYHILSTSNWILEKHPDK